MAPRSRGGGKGHDGGVGQGTLTARSRKSVSCPLLALVESSVLSGLAPVVVAPFAPGTRTGRPASDDASAGGYATSSFSEESEDECEGDMVE